jgi:hypothetical protein
LRAIAPYRASSIRGVAEDTTPNIANAFTPFDEAEVRCLRRYRDQAKQVAEHGL